MCATYLKFRKNFASQMTNINCKLKLIQMSGEKVSKKENNRSWKITKWFYLSGGDGSE